MKSGVTYKSVCALDSNDVPDYIRVEEMKKKVLFKVTHPFYGCFVKGHITNGAKKCQCNGVNNLGQLNSAINDYLVKLYLKITASVVNTHLVPHPMVPTALLQVDYCCFARGYRFDVYFL